MPSPFDNPNFGKTPFARVWPGAPAVGVSGNSLGFLRYLSRSPATALRVDCPVGYSLTLDRSVTAPNAVLGVLIERPSSSRSSWQFMFPGDTVFCPEGFRQFWIFNADWMEGASFAIDVQARPVGYCGFLVGTSPDGSAPTQAAVEPAARVVHVSNLITLAPFFSPGRATRFNLKISALNGGAVTGVPFTLQIEHRGFFRDSAVVAGFERETLDFPTQSSYAALTRAWITAGATPAYPTSRSFDLPPAMIHAFVYINHRAWSGAITDFQCVIEAED